MSKRAVPDLKALFKQAAEIAQGVPESMQEAAFHRAIDFLTGSARQDEFVGGTKPKESKRKKTAHQPKANDNNETSVDLIANIDSTQYPDIFSARKTIDRALMILKIALHDFGIDGLTPSEVVKILTEKFRINSKLSTVSDALGKHTNLVSRQKKGNAFVYKIMTKGENYLAQLGKFDEASSPPQKTTSNRAGKKKKPASGNNKTANKTTSKPKTSTKASPKAEIIKLIDSGFFAKGRTAPEVQAHLKKNRGFAFGADILRMTMLRLIREERLVRSEDDKGNYEYKKS